MTPTCRHIHHRGRDILLPEPLRPNDRQGHAEFETIGTLKDWEGWRYAHQIEVPTLLLNGKYDEVMDFVMEPFFRVINKVRWVTLPNSSHVSMWEDRERYMQLVGDFLEGA